LCELLVFCIISDGSSPPPPSAKMELGDVCYLLFCMFEVCYVYFTALYAGVIYDILKGNVCRSASAFNFVSATLGGAMAE